jgi:uncharacterized Zn finger protein (UPF0148 family)
MPQRGGTSRRRHSMSLVACAVCKQPFYASCHDGACGGAICPYCEYGTKQPGWEKGSEVRGVVERRSRLRPGHLHAELKEGHEHGKQRGTHTDDESVPRQVPMWIGPACQEDIGWEDRQKVTRQTGDIA